MSEGVDYKIRVDDSGLEGAAKKAADLENQLSKGEAEQTKRTKEGVNARTQLIRDGLAQNLRAVRETTQSELAVLKDKLKKEEIDQKEYAARYVQIMQSAQSQVQQIKAQKTKLLPPELEKQGPQFQVGLGFAAGAIGVGALSKELVGLAEHATKAQATVEGLESVVRFKLGQEAVPAASRALKEITASGLLSQSDGATALKNLVSMGYALDQATTIIQRNTDIAIKNRQAHYSVSEAVRVFTEGVKNGNSVLTDATGITENLEPMLKKYGFTAQDLGDKVNGAAARQALLKEVIKQTEPFVGDAAKAAETFTGVMAKMSQQADETKAVIGKVAAEGLTPLFAAFTSGLKGITEFVGGLSGTSQKILVLATVLAAVSIPLTMLITSAYAAAGGFVAMAAAMKTAFMSMLASPLFLVIAGIAALTAGIIAFVEAGKATSGEQLVNEKKKYEELAKSVELTVEQKRRLSEINNQLKREYGELIDIIGVGIGSFNNMREAIRELDMAKKRVGDFAEFGSSQDYTARVRELESTIQKSKERLKQTQDLWFWEKDLLPRKIKEAEAELAILQKGAMKPKETKTPEAVRVPVIFVPDQTSLQILKDRYAFNEELLAADQSLYLSIQIQRQNDLNNFEQNLLQKRFKMKIDGVETLASLDELEQKKNALERLAANTQDQRKKNELAAAQKHNQQLLDATKRRVEQEKQLRQQQDDFNKKAATEMFEFGQAILSAEEGAFIKYLANRLRMVTRALAEEMYAKAAGYAAVGNFPMAALYAAGGFAVQAAGEFGARAIESTIKKEETGTAAPGTSFPETPAPPATPEPGTTVITQNNVDSRVIINEYGTYMSEAEFIRQRVRPELAKIAAERGRVMFK